MLQTLAVLRIEARIMEVAVAAVGINTVQAAQEQLGKVTLGEHLVCHLLTVRAVAVLAVLAETLIAVQAVLVASVFHLQLTALQRLERVEVLHLTSNLIVVLLLEMAVAVLAEMRLGLQLDNRHVMVQQILAAVAGHPVMVVQAWSSSDTLVHNVALAVLLHRLAGTPSTHLHRLARIQHKENLNGTFCKSC